MRSFTFVIGMLFIAACGDNDGNSPPPIDSAPAIDTPPAIVDAPIDSPDPRGPAVFALAGGANGAYWDDITKTLFITDSNANTLVKYTDAGGLETVVALPPANAPAGISLGDIVRLAGGKVLVANFGFGTDGTLFQVEGTTSSRLTGLSPTRRRIGLAAAPDGTLWDAYFENLGGQKGGVSQITIAGSVATEIEVAGETKVPGTFGKLVGLVATNTAVFVSNQTDATIRKVTVPGFVVTTIATLTATDLLAIMPNGDLLSGGTTISRVTQAGVVTALDFGVTFESVRGMSYDPTLKRLFVIEHATTVGNPDRLHVFPLDN